MVSNEDLLIEALPSTSRLALTYAPRRARSQTLALLALDARLAHLLRHSREPMMAQLRFAWWRETLGQDAGQWPDGEPLLDVLKSWNGQHRHLIGLVDGWENLTGAVPLPTDALQNMARGRAEAFAELAVLLDRDSEKQAAADVAETWAFYDLATRLGDPAEQALATSLALESNARGAARLSRKLRPLKVLRALSQTRLQRGGSVISPADLLKAMRVGLLGR